MQQVVVLGVIVAVVQQVEVLGVIAAVVQQVAVLGVIAAVVQQVAVLGSWLHKEQSVAGQHKFAEIITLVRWYRAPCWDQCEKSFKRADH